LVELNGPKLAFGAGSFSTALRLWPTETVWCKSSSVRSTISAAVPGHMLALAAADALGAGTGCHDGDRERDTETKHMGTKGHGLSRPEHLSCTIWGRFARAVQND